MTKIRKSRRYWISVTSESVIKPKMYIGETTFSYNTGCRVQDGFIHELSCRGCDASQFLIEFVFEYPLLPTLEKNQQKRVSAK